MSDPADPRREAAIARLFELHCPPVLPLAVLLGADDPENVVAEAHDQFCSKWRPLRSARGLAAPSQAMEARR